MSVKKDILCFCNNVGRTTLERAIAAGAHNLSALYDASGAGTGPCGGSCRRTLLALLDAVPGAAPTPTGDEPGPELIQAISLFNRRYYWECHEVLEKIWLVETGPARFFFQGIIQASAAFYHVLGANPKGVLPLALEAQNKLRAYAPQYQAVELSRLIESLGIFAVRAREILGRAQSGFDYDLLPQIEISDRPRSATIS